MKAHSKSQKAAIYFISSPARLVSGELPHFNYFQNLSLPFRVVEDDGDLTPEQRAAFVFDLEFVVELIIRLKPRLVTSQSADQSSRATCPVFSRL
mmetsp:Transcript_1201/g.3372  ORF Transcript_1201/g.3372 Transcript_1201/m.3372 type:complete len:95 (-) Transcript_1201:67-351(-)